MGDDGKKSILKKIIDWIVKSKKSSLILIIGVIGIALIMISELLPDKKSTTVNKSTNLSQNQTTASDYVSTTEQKITELLSSIEGVGKTNVFITLENGYEYVFAREEKVNTDRTQDNYDDSHKKIQSRDSSETKYILIDDGNNEKALITTELEPKIKGVIVVCEGGDKTSVKQRVTDAVTTAFGISTTKVCVTKINTKTN